MVGLFEEGEKATTHTASQEKESKMFHEALLTLNSKLSRCQRQHDQVGNLDNVAVLDHGHGAAIYLAMA